MTLKLSDADHNNFDGFVEHILNSYREGHMDVTTAAGLVAHVFRAAAEDNPSEVAPFMESHLKQWGKINANAA